MQIKSEFARLDVLGSTGKLTAAIKQAEGMRIPITITGYINGVWSNHDGKSQEFSVQVEKVEVVK